MAEAKVETKLYDNDSKVYGLLKHFGLSIKKFDISGSTADKD